MAALMKEVGPSCCWSVRMTSSGSRLPVGVLPPIGPARSRALRICFLVTLSNCQLDINMLSELDDVAIALLGLTNDERAHPDSPRLYPRAAVSPSAYKSQIPRMVCQQTIIDIQSTNSNSVSRYDVVRGRLELEHSFPPLQGRAKRKDPLKASRRVSVDIYHVLKTITRDQLQVGSWLNVFGYIRSDTQAKEDNNNSQLYVEAVMISDAGAIRMVEYEQSLTDMQSINRKLQLDT